MNGPENFEANKMESKSDPKSAFETAKEIAARHMKEKPAVNDPVYADYLEGVTTNEEKVIIHPEVTPVREKKPERIKINDAAGPDDAPEVVPVRNPDGTVTFVRKDLI